MSLLVLKRKKPLPILTIDPMFKKLLLISNLTILLLTSVDASAAGLEKETMTSAKYSGMAAAVTSYAQGPEALIFNPAGLSKNKSHGLTISIDPLWSSFESPIIENKIQKTDSGLQGVPLELLGQYTLNKNLALGVGVYAAGGSGASYGAPDYTSINPALTMKPKLSGKLGMMEASTGIAYDLGNGFSFGAAWRILLSKSESHTNSIVQAVAPGTPGFTDGIHLLQSVDMTNLEGVNYGGFRLGMQYESPDKNWGLGVHFRSSVEMKLKGDLGGTLSSSLPETAAGNATRSAVFSGASKQTDSSTGSRMTYTQTFPFKLSLGGHHKLTEKLLMALDYRFIKYSDVDKIKLTGSLTSPTTVVGSSSSTVALPNEITDWKDEHGISLGFEYGLKDDLKVRWGAGYVTQVVSKKYASPLLPAPGPGLGLTAGLGNERVMGKDWDIDLAFEVGQLSSNVSVGDQNNQRPLKSDGTNTANNGLNGDFKTTAFTAHLGSTYRF